MLKFFQISFMILSTHSFLNSAFAACEETALMKAAWANDEILVRDLLKKGAKPNKLDCHKQNALHFAVGNDWHEDTSKVIELLAKSGINLNQKNDSDAVPLAVAMQTRKLVHVKTLIRLGADVNADNPAGEPLIFSKNLNWPGYVILPLFNAKLDLNKTDSEKRTALMAAVDNGMPLQELKKLLARGAAIKAKDKFNSTALHYAINLIELDDAEHLKVIEFLIQSGLSVNSKSLNRSTPFISSINMGLQSRGDEELQFRKKLLRLMLEAGGKINSRDIYLAETPLMKLMYLNNVDEELLDLFREAGADVNAQDQNGWTPLHWAMHFGNIVAINYLYQYGANTLITDKWNDAPYCLIQSLETAMNIPQIDSWINHPCGSGEPPIDQDYAYRENQKFERYFGDSLLIRALVGDGMWTRHKLADYLMSIGADVNVKSSLSGMTPLMYMARIRIASNNHGDNWRQRYEDHLVMMKKLIKAGAQVNEVDLEGKTSLIHAILSDDGYADEYCEPNEDGKEGNIQAARVRLLLENGADKFQKDQSGKMACDYAKEIPTSYACDERIKELLRCR